VVVRREGTCPVVGRWRKPRDSFDLETQGHFQPGNTGTVQLEGGFNLETLGAPFNPQVVIGD